MDKHNEGSSSGAYLMQVVIIVLIMSALGVAAWHVGSTFGEAANNIGECSCSTSQCHDSPDPNKPCWLPVLPTFDDCPEWEEIYTGNATWGTFVIRSPFDMRIEWSDGNSSSCYTSLLWEYGDWSNWDTDGMEWRLHTVGWLWSVSPDWFCPENMYVEIWSDIGNNTLVFDGDMGNDTLIFEGNNSMIIGRSNETWWIR